MKKFLCLALAALMMVAMATTAFAADYKIAILTGTTSQGEEEYRAAQALLAKYPDIVVTDTYPDNFMAEQETTVSKLLAFAADPQVKAIIMCQAVPGAKAAFDKIKEMGRDDILTIAGVPQEDPDVIAAAADVVMYADEIEQGNSIMDVCAEWGVDVFVHYSFPRHMAMELIVGRHALLKENAEALGIEFVDRTAPDPTAEAGPSASQQFILEDVPAVMKEYEGKKVAFFTTNCSMQEPLQVAVLGQENAYYPQPCCPSPYHAFPAALSLGLEKGKEMDTGAEGMLKLIAAKLNETGAAGRFSTWPAPINMTLIDVGYDYAVSYLEGQITERNDAEALKKLFDEKLGGASIKTYTDANGNAYDNYYTIMLEPVNFNDYLAEK